MKTILLTLFVCFIYSCSPSTLTGPISAATSLTILDGLKSTVDETINSAEYAYNKSVNNTASQLHNLIFQLSHSINETVESVDQKITKQQYMMLGNIQNLVDEFLENIKTILDDSQNIINTAGQIVSDLPGTPNEPKITKSDLSIYVKDWTKNLKLKYSGYNLDKEGSYLKIGNNRIPPSNAISTSIEFRILDSLIQQYIESSSTKKDSFINFNSIDALLVIPYKKSWYSFNNSTKNFPIKIKVLPRKIGTIEVVYEVKELKGNKEKFQVADCIVTTRGTRTNRKNVSKSFPFTAPTKLIESCKKTVTGIIVPGSIKAWTIENRHGGGFSVDGANERAFTINMNALSDRKRYGGGGKHVVRCHYDVQYPCLVPSEKTIKNIDLIIGKDVPINLSSEENPRFKYAISNLFDSSTSILSNDAKMHGLVKLSYDESLKQILIKPIKVARN